MLSLLSDHLPSGSSLKGSQKVRVMSEAWAAKHVFCPACGRELHSLKANQPVADFECGQCRRQYELKSKAGLFGKKIVDGAYATMMQRLSDESAPNLLLLSYEKTSFKPLGFFAIPSRFFRPVAIEKRKPLSDSARRAGWVGCNILLGEIPLAGRITYIQHQSMRPKAQVMEEWRMADDIAQARLETKGWLLDVMLCVDSIGKPAFTLADVYRFETHLAARHPGNNFVRDKIRQQLQRLRDIGYLHFTGRGHYRLAHAAE
ncbi:MAG: DpnI domain-containing protein [Moraxellaceae bacterium]|nr:DpnI domain-containing protein [Moraxellaceae bacterium]